MRRVDVGQTGAESWTVLALTSIKGESW